MIIELSGSIKIKITTAVLQSDGDIEIFSVTNFRELEKETRFPVCAAYLTEYENEWFLAARLDIPEEMQDEFDDIHIFEIKNQENYRLKAFL